MKPARAEDGIVNILDFFTRFAYFREVVPIAHAIEHDILNLSAALWKVELLFALSGQNERQMASAAATDVEYILVTCRSVLDLLQRGIRKLWRRVRLGEDGQQGKPKRELPGSLADVIATGDMARAESDIRSKYQLPDPIVQFYLRWSDFVLKLRSAREAVVHLPTETPFVFRMKRGFGVKVDLLPFRELAPWDPAQCEVNNIGSLRFFLATVVLQTLRVGEDLAETLTRSLRLPADIAPDLHVFLRSPHVGVLHRLDHVCREHWAAIANVTAGPIQEPAP